MSTLLFWQNNRNSQSKNGQGSQSAGAATGAPGNRNWLHAPDVLLKGHVAYLVKFLGTTPVDQPKGIEVVKEAIRRLQFTQQLKKAESGAKTRKVEITVSVDGVAIQEPRSNAILHQFPLHRISYCADDKGAKKFFSFIAKSGTSPANGETETNNTPEGHECFVFISNKLAAEITLTIGQAFDLAYRRFMSDGGKYLEIQKLNAQNKHLEQNVNILKQRLTDLSEIIPSNELERYLQRNNIKTIAELSGEVSPVLNGTKTPDLGIDLTSPDDQNHTPKHFAPAVPPRNLSSQFNISNSDIQKNEFENFNAPMPKSRSNMDTIKSIAANIENLKTPSVGAKLEGLLLNSDSDSDFDPRASESENKFTNDMFGFDFGSGNKTLGQTLFPNSNGQASSPPLLAPPPKPVKESRRTNLPAGHEDLFGSTPFNPGHNANSSFSVSPNNGTNFTNLLAQSANNQAGGMKLFGGTSDNSGMVGFDPFDMGDFGNKSKDNDSSGMGLLDRRINEMKDGFSRGLAFGNDDFSLESLDPLRK